MYGIDLNNDIQYLFASLRYFDEKEYHVDRICSDDVLLLVFEGVLRFSEDGVGYEIHPGEYHIQKHNSVQKGDRPSDSPKYIYVHFKAQWTNGSLIAKSGTFDYESLKDSMEAMSSLSHSNAPYIIQTAMFYSILSKLCKTTEPDGIAQKIAEFISKNSRQDISIDMLCQRFFLSKNHIINVFKKAYHTTPNAYLNAVRLRNAEELLITTSLPIENISLRCGYRNYSHFYRQFVRKNLISPEQFRRQKRIAW